MTIHEHSAAVGTAQERPDWDIFRPGLFAGSVVLVTGAAGGMGSETTVAFASLGADVILTDVAGDALNESAAACSAAGPGNHRAVVADQSDAEGVARVFQAVDEYGRLDHVVACSAVLSATPTKEQTWDNWTRTQSINSTATYFVLRESYLRMLPEGKGTIVAVASDAGKAGGGGIVSDASYAASKASVLSMVKSLAREFAKSGVRINSLTPGPTKTGFHGTSMTPELVERIAGILPIGRMGRPEDMVGAILYLSSPAASFVYGASLNVDGGNLLE